MRRDPLITVVMACHNSSRYLSRAVGSVLEQTVDDLELILIDDGSTDSTLDIAKDYERQDGRVSVVSTEKKSGPASARNAGIRSARGTWLGILDSDDVAMPTRFEEQLRVANREGLVLIGSGCVSIDHNGQVIKQHRYPTDHDELVKRLSSLAAVPPHSSMMYRREVVERLGCFNARYIQSEDYDLWLRLSEVGKIAAIDKALVKIRKHGQNLSNSEQGMSQSLFSIAAAVCHFLRARGSNDPSASNQDEVWRAFIEWVDRRIKEESVLDRRRTWARARTEFYAAEAGIGRALRFLARVLGSGQARVLAWERLFGSSLPERLAREWMGMPA